MDEHIYKILVRVAVVLTVAWVFWTIYDGYLAETEPGAFEFSAAMKYLEDGHHEDALKEYQGLLAGEPNNAAALRGKAQALMLMERYDEALPTYDEAIDRAPDFGATFANRGILKDRMGDYPGALADYEKAIRLDPEVSEGPGFLTRFMRNQSEKPPTIIDRARYLQDQLNKPESERLLLMPEEDARQRPYKM
ncbi:MAG: tetratricopeptide repeat protein [Pseudomonadota bacterium]